MNMLDVHGYLIIMAVLSQNAAEGLNIQRRPFPSSRSYVNFNRHPIPRFHASTPLPHKRPSIRFDASAPIFTTTSSPFAIRVTTDNPPLVGSTTLRAPSTPVSSTGLLTTTPIFRPTTTAPYEEPFSPTYSPLRPSRHSYNHPYIPSQVFLLDSDLCSYSGGASGLFICSDRKKDGDRSKDTDSEEDEDDIFFEYEDEVPSKDKSRVLLIQIPTQHIYPGLRRVPHGYHPSYRGLNGFDSPYRDPRIYSTTYRGVNPHRFYRPNNYIGTKSPPSLPNGFFIDKDNNIPRAPPYLGESPIHPSLESSFSPVSTHPSRVLPSTRVSIPNSRRISESTHPKLPPGYKIFEAVPGNIFQGGKFESLREELASPNDNGNKIYYDDEISSPEVSFHLQSEDYSNDETFDEAPVFESKKVYDARGRN